MYQKVPVPDLLRLGGRHAVPVVLQQERAECGLACLAMIAGYFGKSISLETLRAGSRLSGLGATFQELVATAQALDLIARPVRLSIEELGELKLPAILHWRMNHFVVLVTGRRRQWQIHDPSSGSRKVSPQELDEAFTGVALEFVPGQNFRPQANQRKLGFIQIVGSFGKLRRYLALMLFLLFVTQFLSLVPAIATQVLIDEVVLGQDRRWLYRGLAGLALVMLAALILEGLRSWIALYAGTRLATDSTVRVMNHLLGLPVEFITSRHVGDLMSKLQSLTPIREVITTHGVSAVVQFSVLISTIVIMFFYSPRLTMVSIGGLALSMLLTAALIPASLRLSQQQLIHRAAESTSLVETLRAFDTVRCLGLGVVRRLHWQQSFLAATATGVRQGRLSIVRTVGTAFINSSEQILFLAVGISGIIDREITLGVLFAFVAMRARVAGAMVVVIEQLQRFAQLQVHTHRILDILSAAPVPTGPAGAVTGALVGNMQAAEVGFAYADGKPVIRNFACHIEAGTHVVIRGPSGCGKTTLLRLLAGHLEATAGHILIDGVELGLWNPQALVAQTACVLQGDQVFQGTIGENIAAFSPTPDLARIRLAAVQAEVWSDIQALPMRLETLIGEAGTGLSGGQIQRLMLARALYRAPKVLFLDEATSHLDVQTERRVLANISKLCVTTISVAHRPDVIALADQIIDLGSAGPSRSA